MGNLFTATVIILTLAIQPISPAEKCYKLAFGSCFRQTGTEKTGILQKISEQKPDSFLWLGDIAYLDRPRYDSWWGWIFETDRMARHRARWESITSDPNYQTFKKTTKWYSIWDDHDYGDNDGNKYYAYKEQNKQLWLEFMQEPKESPRWARNGLYESYYLDPDRQIKLILQDNRYNKMSTWESWTLDFADSFGEEQWSWLENEIREFEGKFLILGSGIFFVTDDQILPEYIYADTKRRVYQLLGKYGKENVVVVSGDVHHGRISVDRCAEEALGYKFWDFTSSGLTHAIGGGQMEYWILRPQERVLDPRTYAGGRPAAKEQWWDRNFGTLDLCYGAENERVDFSLFDSQGSKVLGKALTVKKDFNRNPGIQELPMHERLENYDDCVQARGRVRRRVISTLLSKAVGYQEPWDVVYSWLTLVVMYNLMRLGLWLLLKVLWLALYCWKPLKEYRFSFLMKLSIFSVYLGLCLM